MIQSPSVPGTISERGGTVSYTPSSHEQLHRGVSSRAVREAEQIRIPHTQIQSTVQHAPAAQSQVQHVSQPQHPTHVIPPAEQPPQIQYSPHIVQPSESHTQSQTQVVPVPTTSSLQSAYPYHGYGGGVTAPERPAGPSHTTTQPNWQNAAPMTPQTNSQQRHVESPNVDMRNADGQWVALAAPTYGGHRGRLFCWKTYRSSC